MSRYIAVNEFYDKMYEWVRMHGGIIRNEMQAILEAVSYIDIVRCKECKWGKPYSDKQLECDALGLGGLKFPDDFCSYGERKESE